MNALGLDKAAPKLRIAVAMSGGVDSSTTAALLKEQGHEVFGLTMLLGAWGETAIRDARRVAEKLGIGHDVLDLKEPFSRCVIKPFAESYAKGETPNPCAVCNKRIKFGEMMQAAKERGAEALATGHYARLIKGASGIELHRAANVQRDQSYFLFGATHEQLEFLRFPLGEMKSKTEVRALAAHYGLPVAEKPDSQDICFVPGGDYASVVRRFCPEAFESGEITDRQGNVLGRHEGIIHFTVGQRRGLNIHNRAGENNEPLYVVRLESKTKRVIAGPRAALAQKEVLLRDINWLGESVTNDGIEVTARLRSAQEPAAARFYLEGRSGKIILRAPAFGIASGQAGVIYAKTQVLGGGWITPLEA